MFTRFKMLLRLPVLNAKTQASDVDAALSLYRLKAIASRARTGL
jgi:hypothetical protein